MADAQDANAEHEPQPSSSTASIPGVVRAFLRGDLSRVDKRLPEWMEVLSGVGAGECWHKKSSFKAHLFEVYKLCKIWGQDDDVCKCALFHSAYSNSYVNLAIFQEGADRGRLKELLGPSAEELIHTFCVVPRHNLVYDDVLAAAPSASDMAAMVKHIKTGEPLLVPRKTIAQFLAMTIADFAEQLFSWQDAMFENEGDGRLLYAGGNARSLWPGPCKPGLWHSALSRMALMLRHGLTDGSGQPLVPLPPVFERCTQVLTEADQLAARDAYWRAVCDHTEPHQHDEAARLLRAAVDHNPHIAVQAPPASTLVPLVVLLHNAGRRTWPDRPFGMLNLGLVPDLDLTYHV
eukprot:XP_001691973.1 predicted protein [Chlamydomonas reinhardtii]